MNQITTVAQTVTMTSLELVEYINSERDAQNKERPCFKFPKREACLMAMSYSYDLQAKVYDKMTAMEQAAPRSPAELILAMAQQMVANEQRITVLDNRVAKIENKQAAQDQVMTVLEFALAHGMSTDKAALQSFGVRASRASRLMGYDITPKHQDHKGFRGNVNAYHPDVLFAIVEEVA